MSKPRKYGSQRSYVPNAKARAYARATDNATLSADILNWVGVGEERRWIPVTERLPEDGETILVCVHYPFDEESRMEIAQYKPEMYQPFWDNVTHWMPLPEPPKEGAK